MSRFERTTLYLSGRYTRKAYHLEPDCRRVNQANEVLEVGLTDPRLDQLDPCPTCMGTQATGGRTGKKTATKLAEMDADAI